MVARPELQAHAAHDALGSRLGEESSDAIADDGAAEEVERDEGAVLYAAAARQIAAAAL